MTFHCLHVGHIAEDPSTDSIYLWPVTEYGCLKQSNGIKDLVYYCPPGPDGVFKAGTKWEFKEECKENHSCVAPDGETKARSYEAGASQRLRSCSLSSRLLAILTSLGPSVSSTSPYFARVHDVPCWKPFLIQSTASMPRMCSDGRCAVPRTDPTERRSGECSAAATSLKASR